MCKRYPFLLIFCCFLLILYGGQLFAQKPTIKNIPGLSSKEVYDVFVDSRGFVWVANDLGIARYDGVRMVTFSHPAQSSVSCSGIAEDKQGRIWFYNFSAQIFYIENEEMHLLRSFDYGRESNFPRMVVVGNELIATSDFGIFVLDTDKMTGRYLLNDVTGRKIGHTQSIATLGDGVLLYGRSGWFSYHKSRGVKAAMYSGSPHEYGDRYSMLHDESLKDTAFLFSNPIGTVRKLMMKNDTVREVGRLSNFNSFINTISVDKGKAWVNTFKTSENMTTGKVIEGLNLSSVVTDHSGNTWYGSLNKGLWVNLSDAIENTRVEVPIDQNDLIQSTGKYGNLLLLGTQNGMLLVYDAGRNVVVKRLNFPGNIGMISSIIHLAGDEYIIGSSIDSYRVNMKTFQIVTLPAIKTIKQVSITKKYLFVASARGLVIIPRDNQYKETIDEDVYKNLMRYEPKTGYYYIDKRARAVCWYPEMNTLFVALKDGLYCVDGNGMYRYNYNNLPLYAASLTYHKGKLYVGTFSDGLFVLDKGGISQISAAEGLSSKTIIKLESWDDKLWVIGSGPLQVLDLKTLKFMENYDLPSREDAEVTDVVELGNKVYLATRNGFFNLPFRKDLTTRKPHIYLLYAKVGGGQFLKDSMPELSYNENTIELRVGIPVYTRPKDVYVKYGLIKDGDTTWYASEPGRRILLLNSLKAGSYRLLAYAVDPKLGMSDKPVTFSFAVLPPWWQRLWFKVAVAFVVLAFVLYAALSYTMNRLRIKKAFSDQQRSIRLERQRISSEIHDDIGSGLFAVQLYADMAKEKQGTAEWNHISGMIADISAKIREVIWTTSVENDNLENLIYYIQFTAEKLFEHSSIAFTCLIPDEVAEVSIDSQVRKNLVLIVKELAHNCIKHSSAERVNLTVSLDDGLLLIAIKDDGVGFDADIVGKTGMGLRNIKTRVKRLKGQVMLNAVGGTTVVLSFPIDLISATSTVKKSSLWRLFRFDV